MSDTAIHPGAPPVDDQATRLRAMVEAAERRTAPLSKAPAPRRARIITVSSGKGGVGKTHTCVNLAIALTQMGRRTTLLDADLGMANADVLCGLTPMRRLDYFVGVSDPGAATRAPADVPTTRSLGEIAVEAPGGFRLIPGSVGVARMADLGPREQARLLSGLEELERDADALLIDTGAGLGPEIISFIHAADLALIVATPEPTSIADAYALIKCSILAKRPAGRAHGLRPTASPAAPRPRLALVVNQAGSPQEAASVHARIASVCDRFLGYRLPLAGAVSQDAMVGAAIRKRRPLLLECDKSPAAKDLRQLAAAVWGAVAGVGGAVEPSNAPTPDSAARPPGWLARMVLRGR